LMPSRFEPCGLAQMQAMAYGTIPVVTAVGGLVDTVVDDDAPAFRGEGNGFVAHSVELAGMVDAVHRAVRAWSDRDRLRGIRKRGMATDWSWDEPAEHHVALYRELAGQPAQDTSGTASGTR
jgi:starch synthase